MAASILAGFIGATDFRAAGAVGWFAGTFVGCYATEMRFAKAYAAVLGGVFLGIIAIDIVLIALVA